MLCYQTLINEFNEQIYIDLIDKISKNIRCWTLIEA